MSVTVHENINTVLLTTERIHPTPLSDNGLKGAWYILARPKSAIFTTPCSSPSPITCLQKIHTNLAACGQVHE